MSFGQCLTRIFHVGIPFFMLGTALFLFLRARTQVRNKRLTKNEVQSLGLSIGLLIGTGIGGFFDATTMAICMLFGLSLGMSLAPILYK